jgi:SAM-dependent methyltransferase
VESNRAIYSRDVGVYSDLALMPPERRLLSLFGDRWPEVAMLDVGIGAGRTTYTFAAVAGRYVGIDYSPEMVESTRQRLGADNGRAELLVADARDLSDLRGPFDFVLFSYNGLDSVGHEDRVVILAELRAALKPEGHFLFSSHSMNALPLATRRPKREGASRTRAAYSWLSQMPRARRISQANRELDLDAARKRGWTIVRDGAHNFQLKVYYIDPVYQREQLRETGFEVVEVDDLDGNPVDIQNAGCDPWLHYHCRPV